MLRQILKPIGKALFLFFMLELISLNNAQAFILPESAIWGNQAPQERPREHYPRNDVQNERQYYSRYTSTRQERRQNKTYYSQPDLNQYRPSRN